MATNKIIIVTVIPTLSGDTIASYNAYSDIDGLLGAMTPAEGLAGKIFALSDGVIHDITVKVVWTTAGETTTVGSNVVVVDLSAPVKNWDISTYSYKSISKDVTSLFTSTVLSIYSTVMNPDGTKLFVLGRTDQVIYEMNVTGGDITTAIASGAELDLTTSSPTISAPSCLYIGEDGLKGYIVDYNSRIYQFNMTVAWDLSTATFPDLNLAVSKIKVAGATLIQSISKLYYSSQDDFTVNRYSADLTDISASTIDVGNVLDVSGQIAIAISGIYLSDDLLEIYVMQSSAAVGTIFQYTMTVAGDLTTATYSGNSLIVETQDADPTSFWFDGIKLLMGGRNTHTIYEYTV